MQRRCGSLPMVSIEQGVHRHASFTKIKYQKTLSLKYFKNKDNLKQLSIEFVRL